MNNWKIDMLWMLNYVVNVHSFTPLWPGMESVPNQPISNKPLDTKETMRKSLQKAQQAKESSIAVSYDLVIAKIAIKFKKKNL